MQTNSHIQPIPHYSKPPRLRDMAQAYAGNAASRASAQRLLAYVKHNPVSLVEAEDYDIVALSMASDLVGMGR